MFHIISYQSVKEDGLLPPRPKGRGLRKPKTMIWRQPASKSLSAASLKKKHEQYNQYSTQEKNRNQTKSGNELKEAAMQALRERPELMDFLRDKDSVE